MQAGIASGALASAAVGATNVLGTLIATGLVEGAGRKQLLTASYTGMAATMALMAVGLGVPALAPYRCVVCWLAIDGCEYSSVEPEVDNVSRAQASWLQGCNNDVDGCEPWLACLCCLSAAVMMPIGLTEGARPGNMPTS
eukprot:GHRR01034763.1.p1 GENE.GHRR01034763.1~~GHRR01034763.1.p1  ORF type:complete len:140 (-),score=35.45 GHRR01034763.1:270-689(-)